MKVDSTATVLDPAVYDAVETVWINMLPGIRPSRADYRGGNHLIFGYTKRGDISLTGETWEPWSRDLDSPTVRLIRLAHDLRTYVLADENSRHEITDRILINTKWLTARA